MSKLSSIFLFLTVLILASLLRFYRLTELGTFLADQAIELEGTYKVLQGNLTLIGIKTSVSEIHNGAVMYYLMAPFLYLFRYHPIAGGITQSILQLLTIIIIYLGFKKLKLENVGLGTSFLIAASPLLVRFSRQTMLAFYPLFFATLAYLTSLKLAQQFKKNFSLLLGFLLGFMLQVHYSTLAVFIFAFLLPWFYLRKKFILQYFFFLIIGFITGFLPMIAFELRHQFFQTKMLFSFLTKFSQSQYPTQFNHFYYWQEVISKLFFADNLWIGFSYFALLFSSLIIFRKKLNLVDKVSLLQIASTFIFILLFVRENVVHYAITSFVPFFVLTASLLGKVKLITSSLLSYKVLILLMSLFIFPNLKAYGFSENHGWTMTEGWNLLGVKKAAKIILEDITLNKIKNYNVTMVVDAQNQGIPLRYFLNIWGAPLLPVDQYDKADFLYVVSKPQINLQEMKIWEITSFGAFVIDKTWPIQNDFTLYRLSKKSQL